MNDIINGLQGLVDSSKVCLMLQDIKRIKRAKRKRFFFKGGCEKHGHVWVHDWDRQWVHGKTWIKCYFCNEKTYQPAEWF